MIKLKNKATFFVLFFLFELIFSKLSFATMENAKNILSQEDIRIYKKIFEIQSLPIKNKVKKFK